MLEIIKWIIISAFILFAICYGFIVGIVKRCAYNSTLKEQKQTNQYQALTFGVFKKILPCIHSDRFCWSDWLPSQNHWSSNGELLLWYRLENSRWVLVDVGFWKAELFSLMLLHQKKKEAHAKILSNETNLILADVQNVLQRQIDKNNEDMLRAAKEQQRIIQRLSPMEKDYIKSKVEVDA